MCIIVNVTVTYIELAKACHGSTGHEWAHLVKIEVI